MNDLDVKLSAQGLIRIHGVQAAAEAALQADKLAARNDSEGHRSWQRILQAVHDLNRGAGHAG